MVEVRKAFGVYGLCNTASLNVYDIDDNAEAVLAGINDNEPEWCPMYEQYEIGEEEPKMGFLFGEMFIPFSEVMQVK